MVYAAGRRKEGGPMNRAPREEHYRNAMEGSLEWNIITLLRQTSRVMQKSAAAAKSTPPESSYTGQSPSMAR